jgi:hypothetical protein
MTKHMLSALSVIILSACSLCASANGAPSGQTKNADESLRAKVEQKRDQLSGADKIASPAAHNSSALIEAPVVTDDAPTQVQKP